MTMWLVRAGKLGEREQLALEKGIAVGGWEELPDLTPYEDRASVAEIIRSTYREHKVQTWSSWEGQVWSLRNTIAIDDTIVLPMKKRATILIGKVTSPYRYRRDVAEIPLHTRSVDWLGEYPRVVFDQDLLFSFQAFITICRIERNAAEQRVLAMLGNRTIRKEQLSIL